MKKNKVTISIIIALVFSTVSAVAKTTYPFRFAPSTGIVNEAEQPYRQDHAVKHKTGLVYKAIVIIFSR